MNNSITQLGQDLAMAEYAQSTRAHYLKAAQQLAGRFDRPLGELDRDDLRGYCEDLAARGKSASWLTIQLAAIAFVYRKTLGQPEKVSFLSYPKRKRPLPTVLSLGEVQRLLNEIRVPCYQAIAMVLYGTGLRIHEALSLETGDIDAARGVVHVRCGKGGKPRQAKLSPSLYQWLRQYWDRERPAPPYLFASRHTGKPPLAVTVGAALADAAKKAGLKKRVTPHTLRHCFATHLLEEGTDLRVVSALLGHASVQTTAHYTRVTRKLVRQTPSPLDLLPQRRW